MSLPLKEAFGASIGEDELRRQDQVQTGRELAFLELEEIISKTKRWAQANRLNRGLRLSLPYFDEGDLELKWRELEIIPRGRCLFVPAFVVIAAHSEAARVEHDQKLLPATRAHLIDILATLETAFSENGHRTKASGLPGRLS